MIREDRKLTFSEFPSNPADVIRSPTLESVRTNFPGMRLAFGCSKLLSAARSAVYTDCHACSGLSCRLLIRPARQIAVIVQSAPVECQCTQCHGTPSMDALLMTATTQMGECRL